MNPVGVYPPEKAFKKTNVLNCKNYRSGNDETLQETMVQIEMTNFANEVSILGLKQSVNPKYSHFRRTIWLCFVLAGFGFLLYHLWHRIAYFLSNPVTVKIDVVANDTLVFPAVTICNNSPLKMSSLVASNESNIGEYFGTFEDPQDLSSYNFGRINWTEFMIRNGYGKLDIFLDVKWKLKDMLFADIRPVFTSLGLCYQINSDNHLQVDLQGKDIGLLGVFLSRQREYLTASYEAGLSILLHDPEDHPDMDLSVLLPPGCTNVVIKLKHLKNLPPPHGKCGEKTLAYFRKYSKLNCEAECFHNLTMKRCGCRLVYYPWVSGYRECSPQDVFQCVFNLTRQKTRFIRQCDCSVECDSYRFEYTLSSSYISNSSMQLLQHLLNITKEEVEKDIVAKKIFYADMTYENLEQQEAYSALALMADIGGALGLVLGSTLMTLVEIFDFFFGLCFSNLLGVKKL